MNRKRCKFTKIIAAILIAVMICGNAGIEGFGKKVKAQAAMQLKWNSSQSGSLDYGESCIYTFTLKRSGRVNIELKLSNSYAMPELTVSDISGTEIFDEYMLDGYPHTYNYSIDLLAGEYTLKLSESTYTLKSTFTPSGETKQENYMATNNSETTATYYTLGKTINGQLALNDDVDVYKMIITKPGYITVNMVRSSIKNYKISFKNVYEDNPVMEEYNLGVGSKKIKFFAKRGVYYFTIMNTDSSYSKTGGTYRFTITNAGIPTSKILKVTNPSSKAARVVWTRNADVDGYQIQYSVTNTYKKGYYRTVTVRNRATAATVLRNLRKGATYYVRIRTFKRDSSNVAQWSAWSSSAKVRIAK